ncbi:MAG: heme exporter CcmC family protein [Pseudomonadota bacterium]|jgi:heme exporter protein C
MNWFYYAAPQHFDHLAKRLIPVFTVLATVLAAYGLYLGLFVAPTDATQGEVYRIIFIHVPAAWLSMFIYLVMGLYAALLFIFNTRLSGIMIRALAPTGALMTFIALWTGALWGKPTWGSYWVWDARMTSELLLLFLYVGVMVLYQSQTEPGRGDKMAAVLCLVGVLNVPIIYFSVRWWNTLHQGASVGIGKSSMDPVMLRAMLIMSLAAWAYVLAVVLTRARVLIIEREQHRHWLLQRGGE